jgi:DNA-binding CsgD family transcriptional regulator
MPVTLTASERDLRTLAGIVSDEREEPPDAGLPLSLLADLSDLIPCEFLSFNGCDSARQVHWFGQSAPAGADDSDDDDSLLWEHYLDCSLCSYADRTGDLRSITKVSDFYSARQWHSTGMYRDWLYPERIEHELLLCLPGPGWTPGPGPGRTLRLLLFRGPGLDFSERDRALLTLLRPHLYQAYLDAEHRRRGTPQLTRRQWELLRLVAAGYTNAQIALRLGVSEGTVRKHLENIHSRLHVSSRTAAVTRAFPAGQHPRG